MDRSAAGTPRIWERFFEEHAATLDARPLALGGPLRARLDAAPAELATLKRFVRGLARGEEGPDLWRVERALAAAGLGELRGLPSPALARICSRHGLDEPIPELRVAAIALAILRGDEAAGAGAPEIPAPGLPKGTPVVRYWLSGAPPERLAPWYVSDVLARVARTLGPLRLIGPAAAAARIAGAASSRAPAGERADPIAAAFRATFEAEDRFVAAATEIALGLATGGDGGEAERAADLLAQLLDAAWPAEPARALAAFCCRTWAFALLGAFAIGGQRYAAYRARLAEQLLAALDASGDAGTLAQGARLESYAYWIATSALVRDRVDAGDLSAAARVARHAARFGALTRASASHAARVARLLSGSAQGEEVAIAFAAQLVASAVEREALSPARAWAGAARPLCEAAGGALAVALEGAFFASESGPRGRRSQPPPSRSARLAGAAALRARLAALAEPRSRSGGRSASLPPPSTAPRAGVRPRLSLHVDELLGRHGERYVVPKLFEPGPSGVRTALADEVYARPIDRREGLRALDAALASLRRRAAAGRAAAGDVDAVARELGRLASERFRVGLGEAARRAASLEIAATHAALPWELWPVGAPGAERPIATSVPTFRFRPSPARAARAPVSSLLVLVDPEQPGADAEALAAEAAFREGGGAVRIVRELPEARALSGRYDAVHYAGHHGPAPDGTPALSLAGGSLRLLELLDLLHAAPPRLLFLNACSTAGASVETAAEGAASFVFGALEPLLASPIPSIVGTLWDVSPPDDALVQTFYGALAEGHGPVAAMHRGRLAVQEAAGWRPYASAYTIFSDEGGA